MVFPFIHRRIPRTVMALALAPLLTFGAFAQSDPPPAPDAVPEDAAAAESEPAEVESLTPDKFAALLKGLASNDFATREKAQQTLEKGLTPDLAEVARQHFLSTPDPEVHFRLRRALRSIVEADYFGRKKAFLGIQMQDDFFLGGEAGRETKLSVRVLSLISPSAAEQQGIEMGDQILEVNGQGFETTPSLEFKTMIGSLAAGEKVEFKLKRGGVIIEKTIVLGEMPPDIARLNAESPYAFESFFQSWLLRGGSTKRP